MSTVVFFILVFFFFNDTATTEIYTLSLHDALPICQDSLAGLVGVAANRAMAAQVRRRAPVRGSPRLLGQHGRRDAERGVVEGPHGTFLSGDENGGRGRP